MMTDFVSPFSTSIAIVKTGPHNYRKVITLPLLYAFFIRTILHTTVLLKKDVLVCYSPWYPIVASTKVY